MGNPLLLLLPYIKFFHVQLEMTVQTEEVEKHVCPFGDTSSPLNFFRRPILQLLIVYP